MFWSGLAATPNTKGTLTRNKPQKPVQHKRLRATNWSSLFFAPWESHELHVASTCGARSPSPRRISPRRERFGDLRENHEFALHTRLWIAMELAKPLFVEKSPVGKWIPLFDYRETRGVPALPESCSSDYSLSLGLCKNAERVVFFGYLLSESAGWDINDMVARRKWPGVTFSQGILWQVKIRGSPNSGSNHAPQPAGAALGRGKARWPYQKASTISINPQFLKTFEFSHVFSIPYGTLDPTQLLPLSPRSATSRERP